MDKFSEFLVVCGVLLVALAAICVYMAGLLAAMFWAGKVFGVPGAWIAMLVCLVPVLAAFHVWGEK